MFFFFKNKFEGNSSEIKSLSEAFFEEAGVVLAEVLFAIDEEQKSGRGFIYLCSIINAKVGGLFVGVSFFDPLKPFVEIGCFYPFVKIFVDGKYLIKELGNFVACFCRNEVEGNIGEFRHFLREICPIGFHEFVVVSIRLHFEIPFVEGNNKPSSFFCDHVNDDFVAMGESFNGISEKNNNLASFSCLNGSHLGVIVYIVLYARFSFDTSGVNEANGFVFPCEDVIEGVSCGSCNIRNDASFVAKNGVYQLRFSDIGFPNDGNTDFVFGEGNFFAVFLCPEFNFFFEGVEAPFVHHRKGDDFIKSKAIKFVGIEFHVFVVKFVDNEPDLFFMFVEKLGNLFVEGVEFSSVYHEEDNIGVFNCFSHFFLNESVETIPFFEEPCGVIEVKSPILCLDKFHVDITSDSLHFMNNGLALPDEKIKKG